MPKFIKDKSKVAIYLNKNPLDARFRTENYTFYINEKVLNDIGNKTYKAFNNMKNSTDNFINNINENYRFKKIRNVFYKIKEGVLGVFNSRGVK